jgi:hypothetical protein
MHLYSYAIMYTKHSYVVCRDGRLGAVLLKFSPFLKMYGAYVDGYDDAMVLLAEELNKGPLKKFAQNRRDDPTNVRKLELMSYLIMPVQRIPRYRLLLEEVLKSTTDEDEDKEEIEQALEKIKIVAKSCNDSISRREIRDKLFEIQVFLCYNIWERESWKYSNAFIFLTNNSPVITGKNELGGSVKVVESHRKFILQGDLNKLCRRGMKLYRVWLFNDCLMYGTSALVGYSLHKNISLADITTVEEIMDNTKLTNCFQILGSEKSFILEVNLSLT